MIEGDPETSISESVEHGGLLAQTHVPEVDVVVVAGDREAIAVGMPGDAAWDARLFERGDDAPFVHVTKHNGLAGRTRENSAARIERQTLDGLAVGNLPGLSSGGQVIYL
jgi:hypothetical protein